MVVIALVIIGFFIVFRKTRRNGKECDWVSGSLWGTLIMIIIGMITLIPIATISRSNKKIENNHRIVAMKDNSTISGSFFLGCGGISQELKYYFYYEDPDGGIKLKTIGPSECTIYEENRRDGAWVVYRTFLKIPSWYHTFICPIVADWMIEGCSYNEIRIPYNTIKRDFVLDLE